jgi:hypothetical protein
MTTETRGLTEPGVADTGDSGLRTGTSEPLMMLRARMIDEAGRQLVTEAAATAPEAKRHPAIEALTAPVMVSRRGSGRYHCRRSARFPPGR